MVSTPRPICGLLGAGATLPRLGSEVFEEEGRETVRGTLNVMLRCVDKDAHQASRIIVVIASQKRGGTAQHRRPASEG